MTIQLSLSLSPFFLWGGGAEGESPDASRGQRRVTTNFLLTFEFIPLKQAWGGCTSAKLMPCAILTFIYITLNLYNNVQEVFGPSKLQTWGGGGADGGGGVLNLGCGSWCCCPDGFSEVSVNSARSSSLKGKNEPDIVFVYPHVNAEETEHVTVSVGTRTEEALQSLSTEIELIN